MRTRITIFFLAALSVGAFAQQETPFIATTGVGKMKVLPDQAEVSFTVISRGMDYNNVLRELNQKTAQLEKEVVKAGFSEDLLKTSYYSVNRNYYYQHGTRIDSGYIGQQTLSLIFPYDEKKVRQLITSISRGAPDASFNFGFGISEPLRDSVRNELLQLAFRDAQSQAGALAKAAGVHLKNIRAIRPPHQAAMPVQERMMMMKDAGATEEFTGFNRMEQELAETVEVEWEIDP